MLKAMVIPQMTIAVEHYNRMCRVLAKGLPVRVAVDLRAKFVDGDENDYNVVADLAARLSERYDTRVKVDLGKSKGRITVEFATIDDLERIVALMDPPRNRD